MCRSHHPGVARSIEKTSESGTFTAFANATVMKSKIRLDLTGGSVTNAERKMVGQAPYVTGQVIAIDGGRSLNL